MAPTSPYATSAQVSYLLNSLFIGSTPGITTIPTKTMVENHVTWTDTVIDAAFRSIGYKIPFVVVSGETWPTSQTNFLSYFSALGAAAMAGGWILRPAPAIGSGIGTGSGNIFADMFERVKRDIIDTGIGFRADYYLGTRAEKWLSEPYGPRVDFLEDYRDPTRFDMFSQYTDRILKEYAEVRSMNINWDFMFPARSASAD